MNDEWALIKISFISTCMRCINFALWSLSLHILDVTDIHVHGIRVLPDWNLQQMNQSCECQHTKQTHLYEANRSGFIVAPRRTVGERDFLFWCVRKRRKDWKVIKTSYSNSIMGQDRANAYTKLVNNTMEPTISTHFTQSRFRNKRRRRRKTTIFANWAWFMSHNWIITQPQCKQTNHNISVVAEVIQWFFLLRKQSNLKILTAIITFWRHVDFRRRRQEAEKNAERMARRK